MVVIGGQVASVYEQIMHLPEMAGLGAGTVDDNADEPTDAEVKAAARSKARGKVAWLDSFFEYLSDSFRPILGVLLGASIIIALVNLLISLNVIPNDEASAGWVFVKAIWKGVFYFLPIMVAYNASKKLKVDPWLGGAIMAMLMTPQFTGLMDAKTTTCVENAALGRYDDELGETLGEALLRPTVIYVKPVLRCIEAADVKGVSHITGGGFYENVPRCIPDGLCAKIDKAAVKTPAIFRLLQKKGGIDEHDMFNTFNMGVGMAVIVSPETADAALSALKAEGIDAYVCGEIVAGEEKVVLC